MFKMIRNVCLVISLVIGATACLDLEQPEGDITAEESAESIGTIGDPAPASCESVCTSYSTTTCTDEFGAQTTCSPYLERKAREGRNPMTGETIQIPPKTTLK